MRLPPSFYLFFFNDTATTEIYTLSLHDALPISIIPPKLSLQSRPMPAVHLESPVPVNVAKADAGPAPSTRPVETPTQSQKKDRKSTRLNSSHQIISYAVFCLKKKNQ